MNTVRLTTALSKVFTPFRAVIAACLLGFNILIDVVSRHQVAWGLNLLSVVVYLAVLFGFEWINSAPPKS